MPTITITHPGPIPGTQIAAFQIKWDGVHIGYFKAYGKNGVILESQVDGVTPEQVAANLVFLDRFDAPE